jgi:hypothetical protein
MTENNKCVICGEEIPMNDSDGEGPFLSGKADVLMLGRIIMAFMSDTGFSVEDWEPDFGRGIMHGSCFDKWVESNTCRKCHHVGGVISNRGYCHQCEIDFPKVENHCVYEAACTNHGERCDEPDTPPKCFSVEPVEKLRAITQTLRPGVITNKTILFEKHGVAKAMIRWGGSFVKALGDALLCADPSNSVKIAGTFPDYWRRYLAMWNEDQNGKKNQNDGEAHNEVG